MAEGARVAGPVMPGLENLVREVARYQAEHRHPARPPLCVSGLYDFDPDSQCPWPIVGCWPALWPHADRPGVYAIFGVDGDLRYVGSAQLLGPRFKNHFGKVGPRPQVFDADKWPERLRRWAAVIPVGEPFEALSLEGYLIWSLHPPDNVRGRKPTWWPPSTPATSSEDAVVAGGIERVSSEESGLQPYPEPGLTKGDIFDSVVRAGLRAIPVFGAAADEVTFGPLEELRRKRLEMTLSEVADRVRALHGLGIKFSEAFANLVESSAPALSRAIHEEKRARFRDLLVNAAPLAHGDAAWEETMMVSRLLSEIDAPGLAVLAAIAKNPANHSTVTALPSVRVYDAETSVADTRERPEELGVYHEVLFAWPVVEEWMHRLREMRLLGYQSSDARGGFGSVYLRDLGLMLVRWAQRSDG